MAFLSQLARLSVAGAAFVGAVASPYLANRRQPQLAFAGGNPGPKDCHNPVCESKSSLFFRQMTENSAGGGGSSNDSNDSSSPSAAAKPGYADEGPKELGATALASSGCPADRDELGRHSWTLLHTMAAYYPDDPSDDQKRSMRGFIDALAAFYPCTHCASALQATVEKRPPAVQSREALSLWMCEAHNEVSRELGQPTFKCSLEGLDRRWRTGRPDCWGEGEDAQANALGQE